MQAKAMMMARETRSSMKAKARDGHATIVTCMCIKKIRTLQYIYFSVKRYFMGIYLSTLYYMHGLDMTTNHSTQLYC